MWPPSSASARRRCEKHEAEDDKEGRIPLRPQAAIRRARTPEAGLCRNPQVATASPGRLTKIAAKVNTQVTHIASAKTKPKPKTRRNKKGLVLYVDPGVTIALRRLALDTGISVQTLGMAALNLLFKEHGQPPFPEDAEASPRANSG